MVSEQLTIKAPTRACFTECGTFLSLRSAPDARDTGPALPTSPIDICVMGIELSPRSRASPDQWSELDHRSETACRSLFQRSLSLSPVKIELRTSGSKRPCYTRAREPLPVGLRCRCKCRKRLTDGPYCIRLP